MISKIDSLYRPEVVTPLLAVQKGEGYPLHSTITTLAPPSFLKKVLQVVLLPILWPMKKLHAKMAPTTEELELFEDLIANSIVAGQSYIEDPAKGEKELEKIIVSADSLYDLFSSKWLSWTEGIVFMRAHLLQITMRFCALSGDEEGIELHRKRLKKVGYEPRGDIESQLSYMRMMRKSTIRLPLKLGNSLLKLFFDKKTRS